jgi:alpha-D-ribose 1-methylphosphonate 5-triphosphate diphosphatase
MMEQDLLDRPTNATNAERRIFSRSVVTADAVMAAELVICDGHIQSIEKRNTASVNADDWGDDLLIPGLIDIHTDNLEKHYQPRPGATWDTIGSVMAHDAQCAAAGITTVFDSLCLHGERNGLNRGEAFPIMVAAIDEAQDAGLLRSDHLLHIRCEVTNPALMERLIPHLGNPRLRLLSMMDHRPGQRQFVNREVSEEKAAAALDIADMCDVHRKKLARIAQEIGVALAAHDDASADQVHEAKGFNCTIAEFPVTFESAQTSRDCGMAIAMGAPNLVRGHSHSGNLGAGEAASAGLLDILASDYVPLSMLRAAFMLTQAPYSWDLPRAIGVVTSGPAKSAGLTDRGVLAEGLRADMVRVAWQPGKWPRPVSVWRLGQREA